MMENLFAQLGRSKESGSNHLLAGNSGNHEDDQNKGLFGLLMRSLQKEDSAGEEDAQKLLSENSSDEKSDGKAVSERLQKLMPESAQNAGTESLVTSDQNEEEAGNSEDDAKKIKNTEGGKAKLPEFEKIDREGLQKPGQKIQVLNGLERSEKMNEEGSNPESDEKENKITALANEKDDKQGFVADIKDESKEQAETKEPKDLKTKDNRKIGLKNRPVLVSPGRNHSKKSIQSETPRVKIGRTAQNVTQDNQSIEKMPGFEPESKDEQPGLIINKDQHETVGFRQQQTGSVRLMPNDETVRLKTDSPIPASSDELSKKDFVKRQNLTGFVVEKSSGRDESNTKGSGRIIIPGKFAFRQDAFMSASANRVDGETDESEVKQLQKMLSKDWKPEMKLEQTEAPRNLKSEKFRENRVKNYLLSFAKRGQNSRLINENRIDTNIISGVKESGRQSLTTPVEIQSVNPEPTFSRISELPEDEFLPWKEHQADTMDSSERKEMEFRLSGFSRLTRMTVSNISVRRNLMPGLTQTVTRMMSGGKATTETWQKHNFVLENGKNIQISARQIDGVLQLKLGSSSTDLHKLLVLHQHEIRDHLEKESDIKIDLQLNSEQGDDREMSGFFDEKGSSNHNSLSVSELQSEKASTELVEEVLPKAVRKFGYNQMEWTA